MGDPNQAEHEQISSALEVEKLDINLFRSKTLWVPAHARGAFGGQVISQALVSATNSVDSAFGLHSLHCYFLMSALAIPILYHVQRLRDGRSYATRSVKAVQNDKVLFFMLCSFQKPEPWQPSHQWSMPVVPPPEECELQEHVYSRLAMQDGITERMKTIFTGRATEWTRNAIAVKSIGGPHTSHGGESLYMYWMQARSIPKYDAPFQKCILSYLSDYYLLDSAVKSLELNRQSLSQAKTISMTSSLDHSIYFYDDNFDCGDWLLYVITSPRTGSGRGVTHARLYTRTGTLVAITSQEGVVRAPALDDKAKL